MIALADLLDTADSPLAGFRFVGRARELDLLLAATRHAPSITLIEGEAGIGKSRLVSEAVSRLLAEDRCVLTGHCHPLREPLPYGPVVDALRRAGPWLPPEGPPPAAAPLSGLLPRLADRTATPAPSVGALSPDRMQIIQAMRALLTSLGPTVLVVEDAHWIDEATRDLLLVLARDLPPRLCLVITYRAEDLLPDTPVLGTPYRRPPGTDGVFLRLRPLSETDIRALAAAALGARATDSLAAALHDRSAGLPLIAEEDLITLRDHHPADGTGQDDLATLGNADVPAGLLEAITERLAPLPSPAAAMVAAAAVLAVPADEQLLLDVSGLGEDEGSRGLVDALRAAILRESDEGRYTFRHALARQVAYERLPGPVRRRLHAGAVRILQRQEPPPLVQIAHHTLAVGDHRDWARVAEEAAEQAIALGDSGTAAALLRQVLDHPATAPDTRSRVALRLSPLAGQGVDFTNNARALRAMLADRRLPTTTRGEIRTGLGLLLLNQASDRTGFDELARAVDELGRTTSQAVAAMLGLAMDELAGPEQAERWMRLAEHAVRDDPAGEPAADVRATRLTLRAWSADQDLWADLESLPREGADIGVLRQTARALYNAGETAIDLGEDQRAAALIDESVQLSRAAGFPVIELHAQLNLLRLEAMAGRWDGLKDRFHALIAHHPDTPVVGAEAADYFGTRDLAQGRYGRAGRHFTEAAAGGAQQFDLSLATRAAAGLAAVHLAGNEPSEAWTVVREALALVRRAAAWPKAAGLLPVAVAAALAVGESEAARSVLAEAEKGTRGRAAPAATAETHTARGLLVEDSSPEQAAEEYAAAHRIWQRMPRPYRAARVAELHARALASSRPDRVEAVLAIALDTYGSLDASADLARARHLARALGISRPSHPGRRGYGSRLSPREREIAELLARDLTNQEIANALVISPRTVEHHVANVLKKLAVTRKDIAKSLERESSPSP
ncbi:AAA family ATPase [Streptomyces parvus]|uniref:ATP-binding protein n=1 Tax=Streptomyces parvus TaxID=66428 RepID=UPI00343D0E6D